MCVVEGDQLGAKPKNLHKMRRGVLSILKKLLRRSKCTLLPLSAEINFIVQAATVPHC